MLTTKSNARIADLDAVRSDSLLKLIALANADSRPDKQCTDQSRARSVGNSLDIAGF